MDRAGPWPDGQIAKKAKRYPSDLTDEEWAEIAPLMPKSADWAGRERWISLRSSTRFAILCARAAAGGCCRSTFGPWQTVYGWFCELARSFLFQTIHDLALMVDRERAGREASPSAAVNDSESAKASHAQGRGCDAGKKITGHASLRVSDDRDHSFQSTVITVSKDRDRYFQRIVIEDNGEACTTDSLHPR